MRVAGLAAAFMALPLLCVACDDGAALLAPTAVPPEVEALQAITAQEIGREAFGAEDRASFSELGRLVGRLDSAESVSMAAFLDLEEPGGSSLVPGVYVAFLSLGRDGQPEHADAAVLAPGGAGIRPMAGGDVDEPFVQGAETVAGVVTIAPALVLDLDGDGLDEMAVLVHTLRQGVSFDRYDVYRRNGPSWLRVGGEGAVDAPGLAALEYWASAGAASTIAATWEPEQRLHSVWPWLADEGAAVTPEVLRELVPDGDPDRETRMQEALNFLRAFFDEAHQRFSDGFQVVQPWPGFINGFKATESVDVISVSAPEFDGEDRATVNVLLDLTQREGEEPVVRRFLVETETVREGEEWYLDGVSAAEQRVN